MYTATSVIKNKPKAAVAPSTSYLIDEVGVGAIYAISLRKLRAGYTGNCLEIRRESDNATTQIGFVDDFVDTAAIATFCGASKGRVRTWYDQSGLSYDFIQYTNANQPLIYDGSAEGIIVDGTGTIGLRSTPYGSTSTTGVYFMDINENLLTQGNNSLTPTITSVVALNVHSTNGVYTTEYDNGYSQSTYAMASGIFGSSNKSGASDYTFSSYTPGNDIIHQTTFFNRNGGANAAWARTSTYQGNVITPIVQYTTTDSGYVSTSYKNPTIMRFALAGSLYSNCTYFEQIFWDFSSTYVSLDSTEQDDLINNINTYYGLS